MSSANQSDPNSISSETAARGHRTLPALGLPAPRDSRRGWALGSLVAHILLIALLIVPMATHEGNVIERDLSAGDAMSAGGGGGGGRRGSGGARQIAERVQYVRVAPPSIQTPAVAPPVSKPIAKPITPAPTPEPVKVPETVQTHAEVKAEPAKTADVAAQTTGTGGGTGNDGSSGNGPGSGGGVGSGIGTGRGSGIGPGSGGGVQENFPPSPTELFIPPLPMPDKVRGFHLVAEYDIDETGKILDFTFTPTRDRDYNKRLQDVLKSFRFRPGTRPDGTPVRMKAQIVYDF